MSARWCNGTGRGAPRQLKRPVPLLCGIAEIGIERRRQIAKRAVRTEGVVVVLPVRKSGASVSERCEERFVQQLVTESAIEALDEGVLRRLAWRDVVPIDFSFLRPGQDGATREFRAVIGDDTGGQP